MSETAAARPWKQRLLAAAVTSVAVYLVLYFPDRDDPSGAILGGFSALVAVALALAAVAQFRPLPWRSGLEHARLAGLALGLGATLGVANLSANYGIALLDPSIYERMVERWAQFSPWSMVIADPIMEEIAFRLVLLGGMAWLVARFTDDRRLILFVALGVSALSFGLVHILYPMPVGGAVGLLNASGVVVKSGAAGLLLGWIFWRWGLPYSTVCHSTANATHLLLAPALF